MKGARVWTRAPLRAQTHIHTYTHDPVLRVNTSKTRAIGRRGLLSFANTPLTSHHTQRIHIHISIAIPDRPPSPINTPVTNHYHVRHRDDHRYHHATSIHRCRHRTARAIVAPRTLAAVQWGGRSSNTPLARCRHRPRCLESKTFSDLTADVPRVKVMRSQGYVCVFTERACSLSLLSLFLSLSLSPCVCVCVCPCVCVSLARSLPMPEESPFWPVPRVEKSTPTAFMMFFISRSIRTGYALTYNR